MIRCVLFGNMCSGKTSVGQILRHARGYEVVSAKDFIAANLATASDEVRKLRTGGYLLPDELIIQWALSAVRSCATNRIVVDGFPRTPAQAKTLVEEITRQATRPTIIHLDFSLAELKQRLPNRILCMGCEMPNSRLFDDFDGTCSQCGSDNLQPRKTDRLDYASVKWEQFASESKSVLSVFRDSGLAFAGVANHRSMTDLHSEVLELEESFHGN